MKKKQGRPAAIFRFSISVEDPALGSERVRALLESATLEAAEAAQSRLKGFQPSTELEGGFGGVGETAILLALWHAAKVAAAAAGTGAAGAAGKMFFEKFLAPRLRKVNLLPKKFKKASAPSVKTSAKKKPAASRRKK